jgi:AraC-like DNA-binding protein
MAKKKSVIPFHFMEDRTWSGIEIKHITEISDSDAGFINTAHRDDHYIFIFQERGEGKMMVDFKEVYVKGSGVFCILPGQVHYGVVMDHADVWFLALDAGWIHEHYRPVFIDRHQLVKTEGATCDRLRSCVTLLHEACTGEAGGNFQHNVMRSLVDAYLGMLAGIFTAGNIAAGCPVSRTAIITSQFKHMLVERFREMKSPAGYASALNISPAYLNEAVKAATGMPVSYWIQEEVMTEARRLLYYTDNTVKQVADDLGYEDHTYFTRVFTKCTGTPPLAYRKKYRE